MPNTQFDTPEVVRETALAAAENTAPQPFHRATTTIWWPVGHGLVLAAALGLWAMSLPRINLSALTDIGLVSVLPLTFFAALALLCAGFAVALGMRHRQRWLLSAYIGALLAAIYLIVPLLYATPRYAYVYKHLGVIRYIAAHGAVDRSIDIYQNWPGFFAANAVLSQAIGLDPAAFANWAQPFFAICNALAVRFLVRGLTSDRRRVALAVWIYVIAGWVDVSYLAPQSFGFLLTMVISGVVIRSLRPHLDGRHRRYLRRPSSAVLQILSSVRARVSRGTGGLRQLTVLTEGQRGDRPATGLTPQWTVVAVLAMAAAIVVSHQLTPFFLIVTLVGLAFVGRSSSWTLPAAVAVLGMSWIALAYPYLSQHFALFNFDLFDNVTTTNAAGSAPGSLEHQIVSACARVLSALAIGLGVLGWWRGPHRVRDNATLTLALAPLLLLLVQSYGGEGIYRIYAFMLPWMAYLASQLLTDRGIKALRTMLTVGIASVIGVLLFLVSYFGLERSAVMPPQEVAAAAWFEQHSEPGAVLTFLATNYPSPATANYPAHRDSSGNWGGSLITTSGNVNRQLQYPPTRIADDAVAATGGAPTYLALGPSEQAYLEAAGGARPGATARLNTAIEADPRFQIVYRNQDAVILRVRPSTG